MINKERVNELLGWLEKHRSFLEDYKDLDFEEFRDDSQRYYACLHYLQIALQAVIDMGKHLAASELSATPEELKDIFSQLLKMKVIDKDLADNLAQAVGLRNILVHSYTEVDPRRVYDLLQNDLSDLDKFVLAINQYLKKEETISSS